MLTSTATSLEHVPQYGHTGSPSKNHALIPVQVDFGDEGSREKVQQAWERYEADRSSDWAMPKVKVSTGNPPKLSVFAGGCVYGS